jgi:hypothetical protein
VVAAVRAAAGIGPGRRRGPRARWARLPRGVRTLLVAVVAVAVVMLVRAPHAPPLYDGLGFPDEPYRWFNPPAGSGRTPQWTPAEASVRINAGVSQAVRALSLEQGPQIAFALPEGAIVAPPGATGVSVRAVAVADPPRGDLRGTLMSNTYELTATATVPGPVTLADGVEMVVNMRSSTATDQPVVIQSYADGTWTQRATTQVGTDIYATRLTSLGEIAVVRMDPGAPVTVTPTAEPSDRTVAAAQQAPSLAQPSSVSSATLWVAGGVTALLVAGGVLMVRMRADDGADDEDDASGSGS